MEYRTKEERHAFLDGFEQCAGFAYKYMDSEGRDKLKYIIRSVKVVIEEYEISQEYDKKEDK